MAAQKQHNSDLVLVLVLFLIYAFCALLLCALGANTYRETAAVMQTDYNQRTGVLYLAEKARQNDIGGSFRVDKYNGADALVITEQESGLGYETWIFVANGTLYEEFIAPNSELIMQAAQTIMPMQSMSLSYENDSLLKVSLLSADGQTSSINVFTRSGGGTFNTGPDAAPTTPEVQIDNPQASSTAIMAPPPNPGQGSN
jgi:hypothetical protein